MCQRAASTLRYIFAYLLCSVCFSSSETRGDTSTQSGDPNTSRKAYHKAIKTETKSNLTIAVSGKSLKRIKLRALALPGNLPLSDIPGVSTSVPPLPPSSTMLNRTLSEILTRVSSNGSGVTRETAAVDYTAVSIVPSEDYVHRDLPLPLLIASPVAAVSIIIFVCVAYYCHSSQLDARARQLALKYAVISTEPPACSRGIPSTSSVDMDLIRKTSLRPSTSRTSTPNPTPNGSRRGSMNWVAIGDQEVITYTAARRHSTFIL